MKIAIDFDSTLANTMEVWIKLFHETYPERDIPAVLRTRSWHLPDHWEINRGEMMKLFDRARNKHLKYAAPMDSNFYYYLQDMIAAGHECFVLTANPEWAKPFIKYWLRKYGIDIPVKTVRNMEDKKRHDFDILIDDSPHILDMFLRGEFQDHQHLFLYTNPWNEGKKLEDDAPVSRVMNWGDIELELMICS